MSLVERELFMVGPATSQGSMDLGETDDEPTPEPEEELVETDESEPMPSSKSDHVPPAPGDHVPPPPGDSELVSEDDD